MPGIASAGLPERGTPPAETTAVRSGVMPTGRSRPPSLTKGFMNRAAANSTQRSPLALLGADLFLSGDASVTAPMLTLRLRMPSLLRSTWTASATDGVVVRLSYRHDRPSSWSGLSAPAESAFLVRSQSPLPGPDRMPPLPPDVVPPPIDLPPEIPPEIGEPEWPGEHAPISDEPRFAAASPADTVPADRRGVAC